MWSCMLVHEVVNMRLKNPGLFTLALLVCNVCGLSKSGIGGHGMTTIKDEPAQMGSGSTKSTFSLSSTNTLPAGMTTGTSDMSTQSTTAPSTMTTATEQALTITTSTSNLTTEPSELNITTEVSKAPTQPATSMSNESSSMVPTSPSDISSQSAMTSPSDISSQSAMTSPSDISSQSAMTSSPSHSIPHTTPGGTPHVTPSSKNKFNAGSFLGGVAVGLLVVLVCIGLVSFVNKQRTSVSGSVQYKAMV